MLAVRVDGSQFLLSFLDGSCPRFQSFVIAVAEQTPRGPAVGEAASSARASSNRLGDVALPTIIGGLLDRDLEALLPLT